MDFLCSFARAVSNYGTQNLSALKNLKILSIQSNRLTEIMGLEGLVSLEEFYISHNAIKEITGLENNVGAELSFYQFPTYQLNR